MMNYLKSLFGTIFTHNFYKEMITDALKSSIPTTDNQIGTKEDTTIVSPERWLKDHPWTVSEFFMSESMFPTVQKYWKVSWTFRKLWNYHQKNTGLPVVKRPLSNFIRPMRLSNWTQ